MIERIELNKLQVNQLFALALYTEEYNIHFFRSWANRLRPYDSEVVELLGDLAADARQYRNTLYDVSKRLFPKGLPDLEPNLYGAIRRNLDLPDFRYFVVNEREAKSILNAALSLQKDTIKLLELVDGILRREYNTGLLKESEQYNADRIGLSETENKTGISSRRLQ